MMNHPSEAAVLLATAIMVILQYPVALDDASNEEVARQRMIIFKDSKLLSKLRAMPYGALSSHQAAKLHHCVHKIGRAAMSRAPDLVRLKKWILVRAEAERYISEHRVRALDHGPSRNTHNDSTGSGSDGESDARMDATMFSALWNQESGDPEILVPMRGGRNTSVTPRPHKTNRI